MKPDGPGRLRKKISRKVGERWLWEERTEGSVAVEGSASRFVIEIFMYMALPSQKHEVKYLNLWFYDDAIVTDRGVEYLSLRPKEIHIIR
jgi:hypothetical protein